ncbi:STAS domain-containing protein [Deltaproteobacteria bacterium TL4]
MEMTHYKDKDSKMIVLVITGRLEQSTVSQLNKYTLPLLEEVKTDKTLQGLVIDGEHLYEMDSSGIGWICGKHISLKKMEKKLFVCELTDKVLNVLQASGVLKLLNISTVREALTSS